MGPDMAAKCQPIKLNYRKPKSKTDKPSATLDIAASSADSALLVFQKNLILERINQLFGEKWVTDIRFDHLAQPVRREKRGEPPRMPTQEDIANLKASLDYIDDEDLKKRLERLGQGVLRKPRT